MAEPPTGHRAEDGGFEEPGADKAPIILDDAEAARFLDALENPARFEPGLRWLAQRPSVLPS